MRRWYLAAMLLLLGACSGGDRSPEGAARNFVETVRAMEPSKVYKLLAPQTRRALKKKAERATQHTGGRQGIKPEEMMIVGLAKPEYEVKGFEVLSDDGQQATVRLRARKGKATEDLKLVKVDGHWKVVLTFD